MTSIYDIPYEDIKIFLSSNDIKNEDEAYDEVLVLLKDKTAKGHTTSIIEWMIAHNLLVNNINIPYYTIDDINNMSQNEINDLAKLLTMKGNNRENIKNILKYLHKLEIEPLLLDIQKIILNNLTQLEINDIDIYNLNFSDIINLLKTHRNKKEIRKVIYNNMRKILFSIIFNGVISLVYNNNLNNLSDYIKSKILNDNRDKIIERYGVEEVDRIENSISDEIQNFGETDIGDNNMANLIYFIFELSEINEIQLINKVILLVNKYKLTGKNSFNYNLVHKLVYEINNKKAFLNFLDFIDKEILIGYLKQIISKHLLYTYTTSNFLTKLVSLKNYDLLIECLKILIDEDHAGNGIIINKILQEVEKAIRLKNYDIIIKYINIISTMDYLNSVKSSNKMNAIKNLENFNKLIKQAGESK